MENAIINEFIKDFRDEVDMYERVKRNIHKILETKLNDSGIMALVTSRVKDPARLKEKLIARDTDKNYQTKEDIYSDIVDLIGLRIALYFPNDIIRVEGLINKEFTVTNTKIFPEERKKNDTYKNRFEGYCARHYRIRHNDGEKEYRVEIQVASLLMHAWAEVDHDLAYKQKKGQVSYAEYEALDEINGLVIAGEISLQRLQRLSEFRIKSESETFANHYQLADYIYNFVKKANPQADFEFGDMETLFNMLQKENRLTKKKIDNDLSKIQLDPEKGIIADQLMDLYVSDKKKGSIEIIQHRISKDTLNERSINTASIGKFLNEWIKLERMLVDYSNQYNSKRKYKTSDAMVILAKERNIPQAISGEYYYLKKIRNLLVHGVEIPGDDYLREYTNSITKLRNDIKSYLE